MAILRAIEGILERQRAAVRVADQMQRHVRPGKAGRFAYRQTRRRQPVSQSTAVNAPGAVPCPGKRGTTAT
ncbi:hypothetical protein KPZU09_00810 [Klebsiella pneumoniae]|uniref:Uncharacterized protein n=1 Tax=Klebsiella pneumoniae TaxID=573 RepID=A0A919HLG5_KLEPN|nr:hypothetical protein KPZU09_00810 [Klebsiella pneumoniae]